MKKRLLPLLLVCALLTGCSSMLNREYVSVATHNQFSDTGTDSSALRAETYQELVSAILYLVSQATDEGVIRLYNYTRDVEADLTSACLEVAKEDPLGAYAVDYIKYDYVRIVSYYEANVQISYRRTAQQVKSVVSVTGSSAIKGELREALTDFSPEVVLRVSYFAEDEDYIIGLVHDAYYDTPGSAFGLPDVAVTLYPDSGAQRIVELVLTYPDATDTLRQKHNVLTVAAEDYASGLQYDSSEADTAVYTFLRGHVRMEAAASDIGSTAYAALVTGQADSEGIALAFHLLCGLTGEQSLVVRGLLGDKPYFWNMVNTENGWRHVDATQAQGLLLTDEAMSNAGYSWSAEAYPVCSNPRENST